MVNEYIKISYDTNFTNVKRFDIMVINNPILIPDTPTEWSGTLNGSTVSSEGIGKQQYSIEILCRYGETRTDYGDMTFLRSVFTSAGMTRSFVDWNNTITTVHLLNKGAWKDSFTVQSATIDATNSVYFVKLELRVT